MNVKHIIISRTDSIGDVILTLPVAGLLKQQFPEVKISFLGMPYTKAIIENCANIDIFIDWSEIKSLKEDQAINRLKGLEADLIIHVFPKKEIARLASRAEIPYRIGSTGRLYHWIYCNKLVPLSRKKSPYHESVLNLLLLKPLIGKSLTERIRMDDASELNAMYGLDVPEPEDKTFQGLINPGNLNVILHPRSKGSAREWGLANFASLARALSDKEIIPGKSTKIFITGTQEEGLQLKEEGFFNMAGVKVIDVTGKYSLTEFMQFINCADALVAGSTGPLHIAAALGKTTLGLYPPIRPMHPGRWKPVGKKADYVVAGKECSKCRHQGPCECMMMIAPMEVQQKLETMVLKFNSQNKPE